MAVINMARFTVTCDLESEINTTTMASKLIYTKENGGKWWKIVSGNAVEIGTGTNAPDLSISGDLQVQSDWSSSSGLSQILNKPVLATVATSGSYNDLTDKPTNSFAAAIRSLVSTTSSTGFQISATLDYAARYSVYAEVTSDLVGTNTADVFLEIAATNSTTPADWTTISRSGVSMSGANVISGNTQVVSGFIPAGYFARLRTLATGANSGSAVFTYQVGQENSL
jgi:hypothetical protein